MTPTDLEKLIALGDTKVLAQAVAKLTESERKKLSKTAQLLRRDIEKVRWPWEDNQAREKPLERLQSYLGKKKVNITEQADAVALAVLAVGPLSLASKTRVTDELLLLDVIRDRRPEWIDEWVAASIVGEFPFINWTTFWTLYKEGFCQKPETEDYYRFMADQLAGWRNRGQLRLSERLAAEPDLLADVWKLFEVDTVAFGQDWAANDPAQESWPQAILALSHKQKLDRARLLDATLAGLTAGFKLNILSGFAKLHEQLVPTPNEMASRQATYCDLLSMHQPRVVSFAVKMIKKIDQAKRLDDEAFVPATRPVFDVRTKGPPKAVIALLKKVAKRKPILEHQIRSILVGALDHPSEEIQAAAIDWFAVMNDRLEPETIGQISRKLESLPATLRPQAMEIVHAAGIDVEVQAAGANASSLEERWTACQNRAAKIESSWRSMAGVDVAFSAIQNADWPPPLGFEPMSVPRLSGLERIEPIESVEELIDAVAHATEQVDSATDVERILDGIGRLSGQKPDDFDRRVAPLMKRIEKIKDTENHRSIAVQTNGTPELSRLIGTWLANRADLAKASWTTQAGLDITTFLNARVHELRQRIASGRSGPLLATATHQHGWLDPNVLVERWECREQSGDPPTKFDVIQALLRLAPDGPSLALDAARKLTGPSARALCWALGSDQGPTTSDTVDADIWLAAARSRNPQATLPELATIGLQDAGPDAMETADYRWNTGIRETEDRHNDKLYRSAEIEFFLRPKINDMKADILVARPTVLFHLRTDKWRPYPTNSPWVYDWISWTWPANLSAFFASGTKALVDRLDDSSSNLDPNYAFLSPLFEADRSWTKIAQLTAVVAMISRDQDARGLAVDAFVEAIADGRLHADPLRDVLATLAEPFWLKLNRVADNFAEIARVSTLHAWTVMTSLHKLVATYQELPRDAHCVLALLHELHAQFGLPIPAVVAGKLESVKGSSKTAKLAQSLCRFAPERATSACDEARLMTLEARLDRAERWAKGSDSSESQPDTQNAASD